MRTIALEEHFATPAYLNGPGRRLKQQAAEVGRCVDVHVAPGQRYEIGRVGMAGEYGSGAAVAAQLAQLGEVVGGEESGNASRAGIAGGDDTPAGLAPCQDQGAEVSRRHRRLVADGDNDRIAVARCIEPGDQGARHTGWGDPVLNHAQWQTVEERPVLRRAGSEHDDRLSEAGIEQHARSPGEHRNPADERGLLIHTEALAAAGSEQNTRNAIHFRGGHISTVAGR